MAKTIKMGLRPQLDAETGIVDMQVKEGDNILGSTQFCLHDLSQEIVDKIAVHGLSTILQQRTSDIKENPLEKLDAMVDVFDRFGEGKWEKERQAGARVVAPIIEVLAGIKNADVGAVQKSYSKLDDDMKKLLAEKYSEEIQKVIDKRASAEAIDLTDMI